MKRYAQKVEDDVFLPGSPEYLLLKIAADKDPDSFNSKEFQEQYFNADFEQVAQTVFNLIPDYSNIPLMEDLIEEGLLTQDTFTKPFYRTDLFAKLKLENNNLIVFLVTIPNRYKTLKWLTMFYAFKEIPDDCDKRHYVHWCFKPDNLESLKVLLAQ